MAIINGTAASEALVDGTGDLFSTLNANWSAGDDAMFGGINNDTYHVNSAGDQVFENAGQGTDTVVSRLSSTTLGNNVENLTLDNTPTQLVLNPGGGFSLIPSAVNGTGNSLNNTLQGNDRNNSLSGLDGNDYLYGGNGNDTLNGGNGNDYLSGGTGVDSLIGGAGNDTLYGGTGADAMSGGTGNDVYYVDDAGDVVTEGLFGGTDLVYSSVSETLSTNVENLTLTGTGAISGSGNASSNVINGNSAGNSLSGLDGNDTLNGNDGNDYLYGGNGNDALNGGNGNDYLSGSAGNDVMTGSAGNDTLHGGTGADNMNGGTGNDVYYVDDAGDLVTEAAFGGTDLVYSSVTEVLSTNTENLTLTGTASISGYGNASANVINGNSAANVLSGQDGNDTLNGNDGNDSLYGGNGNDVLSGGNGNDYLSGGAGSDLLTGGAGTDSFVFANTGAANFDTITDFSHASDTIVLSNALDIGLAGAVSPGIQGLAFVGGNVSGNTLSGGWFFSGAGATGGAAGNLSGIYVNTSDGNIWYNPTSAAGADSLLIGRTSFAAAGTLDASDFVYGA